MKHAPAPAPLPPRRKKHEHSWPKVVIRKLLNISSSGNSEFAADPDDGDNDTEFEYEEMCGWERELHDEENRANQAADRGGGDRSPTESIAWRPRRRNSETLRAQYINSKELRICVGTWNVGGKLPPDDLDIGDWLEVEEEPADIYVLGLQEIVPLNAGNIFGVEDGRPVPRWENIIRETLSRAKSAKPKYKCYSGPPSPTRLRDSDDAAIASKELLPGSESDDSDEEVHPLDDEEGCLISMSAGADSTTQDGEESPSIKRLDRLHQLSFGDFDNISENAGKKKLTKTLSINFRDFDTSSENAGKKLTKALSISERNGLVWPEPPPPQRSLTSMNSFKSTNGEKKLTRTLSSLERVGLAWPEPPLDLLAVQRPLLTSKSFKACSSFNFRDVNEDPLDIYSLPDLGLDELVRKKKKRSPFVRIISKQMVGIYLSIWVRRSLRKHIQNLKVSTVGVGVMGYIGNKGSISVSMSVYQTFVCFTCSHLTSGEKEGDELRRNADVQEIHRRTNFNLVPGLAAPKTIFDHERIIWLGDLNYRFNLPYETAHELIARSDWSRLAEKDQLKRELKKGRAFDGWTEGVIEFPPTYKYEPNSAKYVGEDVKSGRRTPAWCDRILSFGKGMRLQRYGRSEMRLSDHRPVTATFMVEVEVFSHRKLQKALTLTGAEIDDEQGILGGLEDFNVVYTK